MLMILSPAKTLDFSPAEIENFSQPRLTPQSKKLVNVLKKKKAADLQQLMGVSEKIAALNVERFKSFTLPFSPENAKPSMLTFKGDVYLGLEAASFSEEESEFAQKHLRILSGLYGLLKPLDLMQPYRLEMGTKLKNGKFKNLYEFWGDRITELLNQDLTESGSDVLLNLASKEYFKAVQPKSFKGRIINIDFKEIRDGNLKVISFNAKKARGRMAHLVIKEKITNTEAIKDLAVNDYIFNPALSDENNYLFVKG